MSITMIMKWDGFTPAQYDEARRLVDMDGDHPAGLLFHAASFDDQGIRVVDLWESAEQFQTYVDTRLMPNIAKVGASGEPQVEIIPTHATFAPS